MNICFEAVFVLVQTQPQVSANELWFKMGCYGIPDTKQTLVRSYEYKSDIYLFIIVYRLFTILYLKNIQKNIF